MSIHLFRRRTDGAATRSPSTSQTAARVKLLSLIAAADRQEACVCDLTGFLGLAQPTVSHHMKILGEAGLVDRERRGKWAYYSIVPGSLEAVASTLAPMA